MVRARIASALNVKRQKLLLEYFPTYVFNRPCKMAAPLYDALSEKYPDVVFCKVDIDDEDLAATVSGAGIKAVSDRPASPPRSKAWTHMRASVDKGRSISRFHRCPPSPFSRTASPSRRKCRAPTWLPSRRPSQGSPEPAPVASTLCPWWRFTFEWYSEVLVFR